MRVLLVGSGGREHAMAAAIARSPELDTLFIAPGNPGMEHLGTCIAIKADDVPGLVAFAVEQAIDLVVPGPEAPLVAGLADACASLNIPCAGPLQAAAALEGSKTFTKEICDAARIPTARWERFEDADAALAFVQRRGAPIVIKADGLAAGKGVVVAETVAQAEDAINAMMRDAALGQAGAAVVIEECMIGDEVSLFAFCSDETAVLIGAAEDHKRIGEGDTGPNTGGMGAVSPPPGFDRAAQEAALDVFVRPMLAEMVRRDTPFRGIIFAGLMLTADGPRLIEYNVRFGDPEAQTLLIRLQSDLLPALAALARGELDQAAIAFSDDASATIVIAARGYPGKPVTGTVIGGLDSVAEQPGVQLFHAGTARDGTDIVGAGGRVLGISAAAPTLQAAIDRAYAGVAQLRWDDAVWRRDIGARALQAERTLSN